MPDRKTAKGCILNRTGKLQMKIPVTVFDVGIILPDTVVLIAGSDGVPSPQ
jgi:hypothetical protein